MVFENPVLGLGFWCRSHQFCVGRLFVFTVFLGVSESFVAGRWCADSPIMTTIRRFCCDDLLKFANVNVDHLTETVRIVFVFLRFMELWFLLLVFGMAALIRFLGRHEWMVNLCAVFSV